MKLKSQLILAVSGIFFCQTASAQWSTDPTTHVTATTYNALFGPQVTNPWNVAVNGTAYMGDVLGAGNGMLFIPYQYGASIYSNQYSDGLFLLNINGINASIAIGDETGDHSNTEIIADDSDNYLFVNAYSRIIFSGAKFGINSSNPYAQLQIDDDIGKAGMGLASGSALGYGTSYFGFNASQSSGSWQINGNGINNGGGVLYSSIFGDIYFAPIESTSGSTKTISSTDVKSRIQFRVSPDAAYAKILYVQTAGWPDFVFSQNFRRKSFSELEKYIKQNHRLPDYPSASQTSDQGLDIAAITQTNVQKIEELTLNVLDFEKRLTDQGKRLKKIQKGITHK